MSAWGSQSMSAHAGHPKHGSLNEQGCVAATKIDAWWDFTHD